MSSLMDELPKVYSLYRKRRAKEKAVTEEEICRRIRWDLPILSQNSKCSVSLDLPISYCSPTAACKNVCYSCQGTQNFRSSIIKSLAVARMIEDAPERAARKMVDESQGRHIRIAGSGEILPTHKTLLDYVTTFGGSWWGFTKRVETHLALPQLMFSIDATTPESVLNYVAEHVPIHRRAYLVRPEDKPPSLEVAVTFPTHGSTTPYVKQIPTLPTDCPAARKEVAGCWACKRCYG